MVELDTFQVNLVPVLVAALANMALGFAWYNVKSPTGKAWMRALNIDPQTMAKGGQTKPLIAYMAGLLVAAWGLAVLLKAMFLDALTPATAALEGAFWGAFIAATVALTTSLGLYAFEKRPPVLFWIGGGYVVIGFAIMGAIIAGWSW